MKELKVWATGAKLECKHKDAVIADNPITFAVATGSEINQDNFQDLGLFLEVHLDESSQSVQDFEDNKFDLIRKVEEEHFQLDLEYR
jgi:hypothetical protein